MRIVPDKSKGSGYVRSVIEKSTATVVPIVSDGTALKNFKPSDDCLSVHPKSSLKPIQDFTFFRLGSHEVSFQFLLNDIMFCCHNHVTDYGNLFIV